jgi:hypothetical protein
MSDATSNIFQIWMTPQSLGESFRWGVQQCSLYKTLILFQNVDDAIPNTTVRGGKFKDKRLLLIWKQLCYLRDLDVWCDMSEPLSIT